MIEAGRWLPGRGGMFLKFGGGYRGEGFGLMMRKEQGLKERKASPIREHERISVFSFLGFQKKEEQPVLEVPVASARKKEAHFSVFRELGSCAMPCGGGMAGSFQG